MTSAKNHNKARVLKYERQKSRVEKRREERRAKHRLLHPKDRANKR